MAIASLIIQPENGKADQIKESLKTFPTISCEGVSPEGDLILLAEESDLSSLQGLCFDIGKIPGVLGVLPSYVTTADEE